MSNKRFLKNLTLKLVLALTLISLLCLSSFSLIACGEKKVEDLTESDYTYQTEKTEEQTEEYKNNYSFASVADTVKASEYPIATVTGWSKSNDNSSVSSKVNSGVVNVSEENWNAVIETLFADADFKNFVEYKTSGDASIEKAKELFVNPNNATAEGDNFVYMLNNYQDKVNVGKGTAQKITSASTFTVKKGTNSVFSVFVKTANLSALNTADMGANVTLTNRINGVSQQDFSIKGINTNGEWKEYKIFVKGNANYDSTITVNLGLGFGNGSNDDNTFYTEGTAYFDNLKVTENVTEIPATLTANYVDVKAEAPQRIDVASSFEFLYDLTFNEVDATLNSSSLDLSSASTYFTKSNLVDKDDNKITTKTWFTDSNAVETKTANDVTLNLTNASYTVKIDDNGSNFSVPAGEYVLVKFNIENNLLSSSMTNVYVNVADINGAEKTMRNSVATIEKADGKKAYSVLIKNNFESGAREFYLELVIGSNEVGSASTTDKVANGEIILSNFGTVTGTIENASENKLYSFFNASSVATTSLYAGYNEDHHEHHETESYSFEVAPSNIGEIETKPTAVKGYTGVTPNHPYMKENGTEATSTSDVNSGLIKSTNVATYNATQFPTLASFNLTKDGEKTQPLMIYNKDAGHYGFISESKTVSANGYASVKVELMVMADAKAYIYLVDTSNTDKKVLSLSELEQNEIASDLDYAFVVSNTNGKWVTYNFYLATGKTSKSFRVEVWNGGRENVTETESQGYVFINSVTVSTSSAFTEPARIEDTFSVSGNPLFDQKISSFEENENAKLVSHTRQLTEKETSFNNEYPEEKVKYLPKYVWAKNDTTIYGVLNTVDVEAKDPYEAKKDEHDHEKTGCSAETDPSTFWLSFSSIILGVVLVLAMIALIVKRVALKRKANESDATSHYKTQSRIHYRKEVKAETENEVNEEVTEEETQDDEEETTNEDIEQTDANDEQKEENLDEYVYGEVQDFDNQETSNSEESSSETSNEENK